MGDFCQCLRPSQAGLAGAQRVHGPLAFEHFHLQLLGMLLDLDIKAAVFVDTAHLRAQDGQDFFIVGRERIFPLLVGQADPAIGERERSDRRNQAGVQWRVACRQADVAGCTAFIDQPLRAARSTQLPQ
ncbi:hypothetical protein D3C71_1283560 [compost metagenome]